MKKDSPLLFTLRQLPWLTFEVSICLGCTHVCQSPVQKDTVHLVRFVFILFIINISRDVAMELEKKIISQKFSGLLCNLNLWCPTKRLILLWQPFGSPGDEDSNLVFASVPNTVGTNQFRNLQYSAVLDEDILWQTLVFLAAMILDGNHPPSKSHGKSGFSLSGFVSSITGRGNQGSVLYTFFAMATFGAVSIGLSRLYLHADRILPKGFTQRQNKPKHKSRGVKPKKLPVAAKPKPDAERKPARRPQSLRMNRQSKTSKRGGLPESAAKKEI